MEATVPSANHRAETDEETCYAYRKGVVLKDGERRGPVLWNSGDADGRHRRLRLSWPQRHSLHWRRDQLRNGKSRIPVRWEARMGYLHFDRTVQVMSGVRLR
jgi:hypothetical protein